MRSLVTASLIVYHATATKFTRFISRPTWFSLNLADATGWHFGGGIESTTYKCSYTGRKIASVQQLKALAKQVWPKQDFVYSMLDTGVGEYPAQEVKRFIALLSASGFDAAYVEDYDPNDYEAGSSTSLCVLNPARHVRIVGEQLMPDQ